MYWEFIDKGCYVRFLVEFTGFVCGCVCMIDTFYFTMFCLVVFGCLSFLVIVIERFVFILFISGKSISTLLRFFVGYLL